MCEFIEKRNVMPGWGCCRCKVYNGLQRLVCKSCREPRHEIMIPAHVKRCPDCGFGYLGEWKDYGRDSCPCCVVIAREKAAVASLN